MIKGVSVKFKSHDDTLPKLMKLIKLDTELKRYDKIVLKPFLRDSSSAHTSPEFMEPILKFCLDHKNPEAQVFIAEGSDGEDTMQLFDSLGFRNLAEKYSIGLIDLNNTETVEMLNAEFLKFDKISYPKILSESFIISMPKLAIDEELEMLGSLPNMIGAFPSSHYRSFFSRNKSKIRKWPMKYSVHDILKCRLPNLAIIDASEKGSILAGKPLDMDKQAASIMGLDWKNVQYIRLLDESFSEPEKKV